MGPRGRSLPVPPELEAAWRVASPKPSRSQRERDVLRAFAERQALETIQLHVLLTACVHRLADAQGGISFPIAELTEYKNIKRLVSISASDSIGEVRVLLPEDERTPADPSELANIAEDTDPHALILPPGLVGSRHR